MYDVAEMFDLQPLYVLGREESLIGNNKTSLIGPESILTNVGIVRVDENSIITLICGRWMFFEL